jgi:hypothetical protein
MQRLLPPVLQERWDFNIMATPAEVAAAKAKAAQQASALASARAQQEAAKTKLATYGNQATIDFTKAVAPKFSAMSEIAGRIAKKAENRPAVLAGQNLTLDQLREKTTKVQQGAGEYTAKVAGITQAEQELATAGGLIEQYSVPVYIPEEDKTTTNLSEEAFINTLKLLMGSAEASKPYVKQLYTLVSKYYKTGSTIPDSINLALYDAEENKLIPEFTTRFSGIFKIRDRRAAGEVIDVPTLAEYVKSQEGIAEVLRNTGLKDLANETFLNQVMGTGKSVSETTKIITDVYDAINTAPKEWYDMVQAKMPFATKPDLAKALLLGAEGAADLERKVNKYGIMAAAQGQGLTIGETTAGELLAKGQGYTSSKPKFGQAAAIIPIAQSLTSIESGGDPTKTYTQEQAFSAVFDQNYQALQNIENLSEREKARYSAQVGRAQNALASQRRTSGLGQY